MTMRVVLADDEPLARERLRTLLAVRSDCTLAGECADGAEAVAVIAAGRPDLRQLERAAVLAGAVQLSAGVKDHVRRRRCHLALSGSSRR